MLTLYYFPKFLYGVLPAGYNPPGAGYPQQGQGECIAFSSTSTTRTSVPPSGTKSSTSRFSASASRTSISSKSTLSISRTRSPTARSKHPPPHQGQAYPPQGQPYSPQGQAYPPQGPGFQPQPYYYPTRSTRLLSGANLWTTRTSLSASRSGLSARAHYYQQGPNCPPGPYYQTQPSYPLPPGTNPQQQPINHPQDVPSSRCEEQSKGDDRPAVTPTPADPKTRLWIANSITVSRCGRSSQSSGIADQTAHGTDAALSSSVVYGNNLSLFD